MLNNREKLIIEWWKFYPERILLSEKIDAMTTRQFGAYWFIVCRLKMENLPGITDFTESKLVKWTKLPPVAWEKDRGKALAPFVYHPATGTIHHEFIKQLYIEYYEMKMKSSANGRKGGLKTQGKKPARNSANSSPPLATPYTPFKNPFISLENADLSNLFDHAKTVINSTPPQATLNTPLSNKLTNKVSNTANAAAPLEAASAGSNDDEEETASLKFATQQMRESLATARAETIAKKAGAK